MSAPIPLRRDFDASQLRGLARRRKTALRLVGFWRSPRFTMARRALRRRRSAVSGFRSSGIGCCTSTSAALTVC